MDIFAPAVWGTNFWAADFWVGLAPTSGAGAAAPASWVTPTTVS